jgi:hypothetical protein
MQNPEAALTLEGVIKILLEMWESTATWENCSKINGLSIESISIRITKHGGTISSLIFHNRYEEG